MKAKHLFLALSGSIVLSLGSVSVLAEGTASKNNAQTEAEIRKAEAAAKKAQAQQAKEDRRAQLAVKKAQEQTAQANRRAQEQARKAEAANRKAAAEAQQVAKMQESQKRKGQAAADKATATVEKRQANQSRRIEQGVHKGYLTSDELGKLNVDQAAIEKMQQDFTADGVTTKDEAASLRTALNTASLDIWTQKHDTEGNQMPVYRLGKNVRLQAAMAEKLQSDTLSKADARTFLKDFRSLCVLKQQLNGDLAPEERQRLQGQYNDLLNLYFSIVPTTTSIATSASGK